MSKFILATVVVAGSLIAATSAMALTTPDFYCAQPSTIHAHFYPGHGWGYKAISDGKEFTQLAGNYTKNEHAMSKSSMFQSVAVYPEGNTAGNMICNYTGGKYNPTLTFSDSGFTKADVNVKGNQWQSKNPSQNFCYAKGNRVACPVHIVME
ncbi:MAG: hypothetical protein COY58_08065 [Gammaproteobacteria bacterium CG_4_10_14_0_8_um_filter_38_16]|nr:MAG: hypothetical protein COY58_08065 [Gammaproteobacteria bacterium CG_4_10_14_0_8_um_filter_38_16]PJA03012.1 MAG: hypothetical protein COX72_07395 [Gammaproteobacteria bacterium CG_4_10_14_0_2_um_filter_38_22]PJB11214.1 MAG: hypothetical protein CO120_00925 [Gammaproteobacteria bacterium CG_4_9_14_3_um_filter_38_9]